MTQTLFLSKLQHSLYILHFYIIHKGWLLGTAYQQDIRCVLTKILMIFQAFKKMMSVWVPLLSSSSLRFKSSIFMCSIILHTTVYICNIFVLVVASRAKNVVIHGTEYRIGASVFLGAEEDFEIQSLALSLKLLCCQLGEFSFILRNFLQWKKIVIFMHTK